jgi:hypothetical protein
MTTSERKNAKRMKKLQSLQTTNPERFEVEKDRLLRAWEYEAWRRVKDRSLPPAGALIEVANQHGLGKEVAWDVIQAVHSERAGPGFVNRSYFLSRGKRTHG